MSQVQQEREAQERPDGTDRSPINFGDLPFSVTEKYVIQNGLEEQYPPRALVQDPRTTGVPDADADADADPIVDLADETGNALRTRSAVNGRKDDGAEDDQYFDKEDAHDRLAAAASEHLAAVPPPKESDVIVGFLYRCRAGDSVLKIV